MSEIKYHDISIDILKCIAAIIITNSHFELLYGEYKALATGGAIGDALFFFCSGFTLFLGDNAGFFNWYKKRINRIYPTVFVWVLIAGWFNYYGWNNRGMTDILLYGGNWFVSCIMIYYVIIWFIKRYAINRLSLVLIVSVLFVIGWYLIFGMGDYSGHNMYGYTYFKWCFYFIYMLLGAIIGLNAKRKLCSNTATKRPKFIWILLSLIGSTIAFYVLCWFKNRDGWYDAIQLLSLAPLAGVCYSLYLLCNTDILTKLYNNRIVGWCIRFIGGLCLEIYLVQSALLTDKMNFLFPLNILIMFIIIVIAAYLLRCLSRVWAQTFKDGDYNLKEIIKAF